MRHRDGLTISRFKPLTVGTRDIPILASQRCDNLSPEGRGASKVRSHAERGNQMNTNVGPRSVSWTSKPIARRRCTSVGDGAAGTGPGCGRAAHAGGPHEPAVRPAGRAAADRGHGLGRGERAQPAAGAAVRRAAAVAVAAPPVHQATALPAAAPSRRTAERPPATTRCKANWPTCRRWSRNSAGGRRATAARDLPRGALPPVHRPARRRAERGTRPRTGRARPHAGPSGAELSDPCC